MSLKSVAGGPSPAAIAETRRNAKEASGVSNKYAVVDGANQASNEFPYVPFAPDSYDEIADIKSQFASGAAGEEGARADNWVVPFTEQDAAYVRRQRDQMENADFDRWVMQKFDLENPAELFLFQQIAPDQFQRRMDLIDYQQNIVSRYAKMRLMGPRSLEDLKFEWLVETGRIELPRGPIWNPEQWMAQQMGLEFPDGGLGDGARVLAGDGNRARYMAGLFSPLKMLTETQVGWQPSANRGDVRGNSGAVTQGQLFEGSGRPDSYIHYGANPIATKYGQAYVANTYGAAFGRTGVGAVEDRGEGARGYGRGAAMGAAAPGDPAIVGPRGVFRRRV